MVMRHRYRIATARRNDAVTRMAQVELVNETSGRVKSSPVAGLMGSTKAEEAPG